MIRRTYTDEQRLEITARVYREVGHGRSEKRACWLVGVPHSTFNKWINRAARAVRVSASQPR